MNDQLQGQIAQILAQILESVSEVKDFSVAQLPGIAQEYVNYGIWSRGFYVASCLAIIVFSVWFFRKVFAFEHRQGEYTPTLAIPAMMGFFAFLFFVDNIQNLILVLTAPKVWFILELKSLLN